MTPTLNSDQAINFVKNIASKNDLEDESTLKVIFEWGKDIQLMEQKNIFFKVLNIRNNRLFINVKL